MRIMISITVTDGTEINTTTVKERLMIVMVAVMDQIQNMSVLMKNLPTTLKQHQILIRNQFTLIASLHDFLLTLEASPSTKLF